MTNSVLSSSAKVLSGLFLISLPALPQAYTISAKPGVVNFIEGTASLNGKPVSAKSDKAVFLNANDVLATETGKAEVLLTPGVFLRLGSNTGVRMISPSLVDTQVELKSGEAMIEVDDLLKDNHLSVITHSATVTIEKPGLYRMAIQPDIVAVVDGKAEVALGDRRFDLNKGHELSTEDSKVAKFDTKKGDDLYAWSSTRSAYDAASSYQTARNVSVNSFGGGWGNYGYAGMSNPGWFYNSGFNSWAWLPGDGAFYSPFGYGFYSPGMIPWAPVIYGPVSGYYPGYGTGGGGTNNGKAPVPVNPKNPPPVGRVVNSPAAARVASAQTIHSFASTGFATASGMRVAPGQAVLANSGANGGHTASIAPAGYASSGASAASLSSSGARSSGGASSSGVSASGGSHGGGGGGHH